jgi:hypothetical protein
MLTDLLLELRAHQDAHPDFVLTDVGRANHPDGHYVMHCYRMPVTFEHKGGGEVAVSVNVVVSAGMYGLAEERARARDLSFDFVSERLPDGFEAFPHDSSDRMQDAGAFTLQGTLSMADAQSEIKRITSADGSHARLLAARYKVGSAYATYDGFLEGPKRPMGLAALRKASQQNS